MRLLVHDTLVLAPIMLPLTNGWTEISIPFEAHKSLAASDIGPSDFALAPSAEAALLSSTHIIDRDIGAVSNGTGAIAMRSPIRPDGIESSEIVLYETSGTAELLARTVLWPYYGIRAERWLREPSASASIVIVEGDRALEPIEAGHSEDLVRAWYILTEQPIATHVLLMPRDSDLADRAQVKDGLSQALSKARELRKDIRASLAERLGVAQDALAYLFDRQQYALDDQSRRSLQSLLVRGSGGTNYPVASALPWAEADDLEHPGD